MIQSRIHARRALPLLLLALAAAAPAAAQKAPFKGLDAYVEKSMKDWEVPGLALAIVKDGQVVYEKGYGVRELGKPDAVDPQTLFAIGSSSKAFTATLMAMLVDSGKVKWTDPVTDYLPWFRTYDPYVTREMTIRDLLTHRSGLSRGDELWYGTTLPRDSIIWRIRWQKPSWGFRSRFGYNNIMFLTAGQVEAAVTGRTWDELVRERIFQPLGMARTVTSTEALPRMSDVATPHEKIDGTVKPIRWRNIDNIAPAGSIVSDVEDMSKWLRLQLADGAWQGKQLVSAKQLEQTHAPQMLIDISAEARKLHPTTHFSTYGNGWFLVDYRGREVIHHGGNIDGFSAEVDLVPEEKLGIVILTNLNGTALRDALPYRIYDMVFGGPQKDWSTAYLALRDKALQRADSVREAMEKKRVAGTKPTLALPAYVGTYRDTMYGDVAVTLEDGHLVLRRGPGFTYDLEHWQYDTFRAISRYEADAKSFVTFDLDATGTPAVLRIRNLADFERVPDTKEGSR